MYSLASPLPIPQAKSFLASIPDPASLRSFETMAWGWEGIIWLLGPGCIAFIEQELITGGDGKGPRGPECSQVPI